MSLSAKVNLVPEIPKTLKEAKSCRATSKRGLTNLKKESKLLLSLGDGIPACEYKLHADRIREQLDNLHIVNNHVIRLQCGELKPSDYASEQDLEDAEQEIADTHEGYYDEVRDAALPAVYDLIRRAHTLGTQPSELKSSPTPTPVRMAKVKFPTFSGDLRDYKRFKEQFLHYSQSLGETECFYQLVESMEKSREKDKIKGCIGVKRAWEILDEAYGDEDRIIEAILGDLENLSPYDVRGKINLTSMENFVETLQNFETQVETIGIKGGLNSRVILTQIRRKLAEEHRIAFLKSVRDDGTDDTLSGLVKWLHSELTLLNKAKAPSTDMTQNQKSDYQLKYVKYHKTASHSVMSPGGVKPHETVNRKETFNTRGKNGQLPSKCPLHPMCSNHFLKGCYRFRTLSQKEKFDVMNNNGICYRCGHNNCSAGKYPFNHDECQFPAQCQIPTCGRDTHFSSICPVVYGLDGYRHSDKKSFNTASGKNLNSSAPEYQPVQRNSHPTVLPHVKTRKNEEDYVCCALPTVTGYIRYGSKKSTVRILLDSGSQVSLLREGIIPKSRDDHMQDFSLTTVGGNTITRKLRIVECVLENLDGTLSRKVRLTEMKKPCGDTPILTNQQIKRYPHLKDVTIVEAPCETIDILLGVENSDLMTPDEYVFGLMPEDPIAAKCPLGWYIQGGRSTDKISCNALVNFIQVSAIGDLEDFLGVERMGLEPRRCRCAVEKQDKVATDSMQQSVIRLEDGTYQIRLPWKKFPQELPNNYSYAVKRFLNLEKQFKNRPREWTVYCKQMEDQVARGVARVVTEEEMEQDVREGKKMWFLPHFGVVKDSKTTPVRVVYDGKARYQGHSLNDYLAKGDNMNTSLFDVALRFREYEVGVIADISKMFQAVKITPEDARFHRYVFRHHPDDPLRVYELTTITFGDKPSPSAAIITLRHVAKENAPDDLDIQRVVRDQFYIDDLNDSRRTVEDTQCLKSKLTTTLEKGNFKIRKWLSNAKEVCDPDFYPDDDIVVVLGTQWNLSTDTLSVKEVKLEDFIPTKRNILKQTASYYDVFGMLSGILVRPKILLQKLWQFEIDWDTPLNPKGELYSMLKIINKDLQDVNMIEIPRCLIPEKFRGQQPLPEVSLHGVSDASEDAMGIGVWLRWSNSDEGEAELSFVCARARLTPLKQSSMPRKELQATLLLTRLMLTIKNTLRLEIAYMKVWSDSMTAISWLRGQSKSFRSYVAYRVGEITSEFDAVKDVAYVPSNQNGIDLVSRGCTATEMQKVIDGPEYLKRPPAFWPATPKNVPVDPDDSERKKFHVRNAQILAVKLANTEPFVDPMRFSSWSRLIMVTARILSLKDLPKNQWLRQLMTKICQWPSRKRLKEAELYWIRCAQKDLDFENSHIMKLNPFFDDEERVYRVGGRLDKAPLSYDIRHPYLLSKRSYISLLIVREKHRHALHGGHLRTASEVRKKYWLIGDINISRQVIRQCITCRRHRGKPVQQRMADLPDFRVTPCTPPFKTTIVDYLGPFNVKLTRNTVSKGYCAVFTCAVTRAVHLTCVQDLTTGAFLQAFERFVSIRGAPALMISDNATCFRGADNKIRELVLRLDRPQVQSCGQRYDVEWKFGPPAGPHHQGAVERMVQEVKKAMKHMVKADKLTFVEWETIFSQISSLINNRPLTAVSSSPLDEPPITPNHFLIGRGDLPCPQVPCDDYIGDYRKRRELCNTIVEGFWKRWTMNIQKLSPRHKWSESKENLVKRDIVLIIDENTKRGHWKLAEVVKTYIGDSNLVRIVDVKLSDGQILKRPVIKLVLLMKNSERLD